MPEMHFHIRWPDGKRESCYSPSLVIKDYFAVGTDYPLAEFLQRSRTALGIASERVKAKYGMPCRRAMAQLARIETAAGAFTGVPDARVAVDGFDE
jgi:uncharacterized repeat protein (TIGR04042 family)